MTLTVPSGSRTSVVGASGSGKSTLLRLIAGFDDPDAGQISLGGVPLAGGVSTVPAHRRGVGYVAQDGALFPHLTVGQNIVFGLPRSARRSARVAEVAALVAIGTDLLGRYPHELSGGQQQRVALARALAPEPQVVLLDEPFSALDTGLRAYTRRAVIAALEQSRVTTILVTHDQEEALSFGDQIAIIDGGRISQAGPPALVFDNPHTAGIAEFLGDAIFIPCEVVGGESHTVLGSHPIRHDHRTAGGPAQALVRPAQLTIDSESASPNAQIIDMQSVGSKLNLTVTMGSNEQPVHLSYITSAPERFRAGQHARVHFIGGVVVYPA
ncbi:ABC transporter ATP-binding protein [Subtercola boreus]|uniref:ABC transporter ATP-binding protein n=1 Tax=Subtercola boreus TaxID=120213 RepID=UPI001FE83668|nr:ABC transporter ATP-binding protein [Subtercola boreus]